MTDLASWLRSALDEHERIALPCVPSRLRPVLDRRVVRDNYDPELRVPLGAQVRCWVNGEQTYGYLKSFRDSEGYWNVWTHRNGAVRTNRVERI